MTPPGQFRRKRDPGNGRRPGYRLLLCTARVSFCTAPEPDQLAVQPIGTMPSPLAAPPPTQDLIALIPAQRRCRPLDALLADAAVPRCASASRSKAARSAACLDREQRAAHGLAWLATYVEAIRQLAAYAQRLRRRHARRDRRADRSASALGEYLAQIVGGIPMSQGEIVRPSDLGLSPAQVAARMTPAVESLIADRQHARSAAPAWSS